MKNLFKYLIIALFGLVPLCGAVQGDNTAAPQDIVAEAYEECNQYQHHIYEPQSDISIGNSPNSFSSNNVFRFSKKNKRGGNGHQRVVQDMMSASKYICREDKPNLVYKSAHFHSFLAEPGCNLIRLGKLII